MEKAVQSCWRQVWRSQFQSSWEEKVFAEDASGFFGGCLWPPRSYLCSFCTREFGSAQALGGHMNVHRRDRARLKQSLSTFNGGTETLDEIIPSSFSPPRVSADMAGEDKKCTMPWGDHLGFSEEKSGNYRRSTGSCGNEAISCKRLKMADEIHSQKNEQVICLNTNCNSIEDLDLELRLGDPPASLN